MTNGTPGKGLRKSTKTTLAVLAVAILLGSFDIAVAVATGAATGEARIGFLVWAISECVLGLTIVVCLVIIVRRIVQWFKQPSPSTATTRGTSGN